jgi:hypothetical protein
MKLFESSNEITPFELRTKFSKTSLASEQTYDV